MNIEAKDLSKVYNSGENRVVALDHANLEIVSSDFISIMGPSGSGKSTLLHLLSGLDRPTSGIIIGLAYNPVPYERVTAACKNRAAPGAAMTGKGHNGTPVQPQPCLRSE